MADGILQSLGRLFGSPAFKLALIGFLVLLLSLAEHIGFTPAYVVAALATSGLVAAYVARSMASAAKGGIMLGVLLLLYVLVYLILRLEDYALLAVAMFLTLGVDWSGAGKPSQALDQTG